MTTTPKDFKELLAAARPQEYEVKLFLRGDLVADHLAAVHEYNLAKENDSGSLAGDGTGEIAERIRALEVEMQASVYPFRVRALPARRYREFKAEHPIRILDNGEPHARDSHLGFNAETGLDLLARLCLFDPELDDADWYELAEKLNEPQMEELSAAAWLVNRGGVDIPFWSGGSEPTRSSEPE